MKLGWVLMPATVMLAACSSQKTVDIAKEAVPKFHARLNVGDYTTIVAEAGPELRSQPMFPQVLRAVSRKIGTAGISQNTGWNIQVGNKGTFVTLGQRTTFARGGAVPETFVWRITQDEAQLVGYRIDSAAMLID
ncbi:hypothetical protein OKW76_15970 [Sphingomonas sp. S1-29]|uniref:hypothetical protein n=1 Tax=Sphingomonas sp. S1-29 TaxID=2991074 RepID=UPI0022402B09|nr:hypothetical protein [Sphingomonas sp. S1-29]UZK69477.1 hypothetical protein OKW76_15970 [Sphingomonas sp. S1-29]